MFSEQIKFHGNIFHSAAADEIISEATRDYARKFVNLIIFAL